MTTEARPMTAATLDRLDVPMLIEELDERVRTADGIPAPTEDDCMFYDAALALRQQQADKNALVAALRPFAKWGEGFGPYGRDDSWVIATTPSGKTLTMGDIRTARAALAKAEA